MDLALFIRRANDLKLIQNPERSKFYRSLDSTLLSLIEHQGFDRLYFGSESCENCMPPIGLVRKVREIASEQGMGFTLVTPVCTEYGLDHLLKNILPSINQSDTEVIINDFGILYMLSKINFGGKKVIGRLLAKSKKWPLGEIPEEFREPLSNSPFGLLEYQKYLVREGVDMVELDNRIEGYNSNLDKLPFKIGMHVPFVYLTSGRMCFLSGQEKTGKERFGIAKNCKQYCNSQLVRLNGQLYSNGRAVYSLNNDIKNFENHKIDRLIISPNL